MKWLNGITNLMDMSFSKLQKLVIYLEAWCGVVHGVTKSRTRLSDFIFTIQSCSCVQLFVTLWTAACQASLFIINTQRLLKLMSIKLVMPFNHLILCHRLPPPASFNLSQHQGLFQ